MLDALAPQCLHSYLAFSAPSYKTCLPLCAPLGKLRGRRVITPEHLFRPVGPVESAGLEFFQVEIERFGHGSSVEASIFRQLSNSKFPASQVEPGSRSLYAPGQSYVQT